MLRKITAVISMLAVFALLAFATPTALTPVTLKQNNYAVVAGDLTVNLVACDNANGNSFIATGQEILLVYNSDSAAHTFTVSSVPDNLGRSDTSLTAYSVAATSYAAIQMKSTAGWVSGGIDTLACNSNLIKFAVVRYQ
jgi:hypothetical protein